MTDQNWHSLGKHVLVSGVIAFFRKTRKARMKYPFVLAAVCGQNLGALVGTPALAATVTVYCDNDNTSYRGCKNVKTGAWSHRTFKADWKLDDRRNTSGGVYQWIFDVKRTYAFSVWLANPDFTDTRALYSYWDDNGRRRFAKYINQDTAPGGWNSLGTVTTNFIAVTHGNRVTGADAIRGIYNPATAVAAFTARDGASPAAQTVVMDTSRCEKQLSMDPGITAIQDKMLNSVDHYQDVRGSFHINFRNTGQSEAVNFEVSPASHSSFVRITNADGAVTEHVANGQAAASLYPDRSAFEEKALAQPSRPEGPRVYFDQKCEPVYVHRQDPAWAVGAGEVTFPENYAFWLATSNSKIVGHEKLLDREATIIAGRHDAYLRKKLGADRFRMWVDDETGVLLKLAGTDKAGQYVYGIDVQDIQFNSGMDVNPAVNAPAGWRNVTSD